MTDWKTIAVARGLNLSDAELSKLSAALEALAPAAQALAAGLTVEVEPATTIQDEVFEAQ